MVTNLFGSINLQQYFITSNFNERAENFNHLYELFTETKFCSWFSSIFHFGDNNPIRANTYLRSKKINLKKLNEIKYFCKKKLCFYRRII